MRWALACALALVLCWAPVSARAQQPAQAPPVPLPEVGRAAACYANLNYTCVVDRLEGFPRLYWPPESGQRPPGVRPLDIPILLDAGRILAISYLALDREPEARQVFAWLLRLDLRFALSGSEIPPRFYRVFLEERALALAPALAAEVGARGQGRGAAAGRRQEVLQVAGRVAVLPLPKQAPPPVLVPPPPRELWSLRAGVLWQALTRADADSYDSGAGWQLGGEWYPAPSWSLGLEVAASSHRVTVPDLLRPGSRRLHLEHLTALLGYELRLGRLGLRPELGLGGSLLGVERSVESAGLAGSARMGARLWLWGPVVLTAWGELRTLSVWRGGQLRTSTLLGGAGGAGLVF